jgi:hypothetical protein
MSLLKRETSHEGVTIDPFVTDATALPSDAP